MLDPRKFFFPQHDTFWPNFIPIVIIATLAYLFVGNILKTYGMVAPEVDRSNAIMSIDKYKKDLSTFPGKPIIMLSRYENGNIEDRLTVRVLNGRSSNTTPFFDFLSILILSFLLSAWVSSILLYYIAPNEGDKAIQILAYIVMVGCIIGRVYHFGLFKLVNYVLSTS